MDDVQWNANVLWRAGSSHHVIPVVTASQIWLVEVEATLDCVAPVMAAFEPCSVLLPDRTWMSTIRIRS